MFKVSEIITTPLAAFQPGHVMTINNRNVHARV